MIDHLSSPQCVMCVMCFSSLVSPSLFSSLSLLVSLALSASYRLFLFSLTMAMCTRPVGSLCTHGSGLPLVPECVGLRPFVGWQITRFIQKQVSKYSCASLVLLGMQWPCTCAGDGEVFKGSVMCFCCVVFVRIGI